jgi:aspartate 4-decarboxylase
MSGESRAAASDRNYAELAALSPFELKDRLIALAGSDDQRLMLNAGRGNPNFLATAPRWGLLALGEFAMTEAERDHAYPGGAFGSVPGRGGIIERFRSYASGTSQTAGVSFLSAALSYCAAELAADPEALLLEMVCAFLGCNYPTPPRMLEHAEVIVGAYLARELFGTVPPSGPFSLFATEGGTAAMVYIFQTLSANRLINPGDKVAIATPIFSPYLEIPPLEPYDLEIVEIRMDPRDDWQLPETEIEKLLDPGVKLLCLVNPSNPPSTKLADAGLAQLGDLVDSHRPDLLIVTDDVYATFADDFLSLFARCPRNTICVYSFSKYFGATGWRLGAIAVHEDNVFDDALAALPDGVHSRLAARYASLSTEPGRMRFIDRLVADSRSVALSHTAGLSTPAQLQMTLFALSGLMDRENRYKDAAKAIIRTRHRTLFQSMGVDAERGPNDVGYYALIDLADLGRALHGPDFAAWVTREKLGTPYVFRLAEETGVVLLPAAGFDGGDTSARVSLANLTDEQYGAIGRFTRLVLDEYFQEFTRHARG